MVKFEVLYSQQPRKNRSFNVRGVCQYDVLNPCWDNRPNDVAGLHWDGEGLACQRCTEAAKKAA